MVANHTTQKTILVDTTSVHLDNSILDTKGNNFAFVIRREVIKEYGFLTPSIIDKDYNALSNTRDIEIALELDIKKIPVIIVDKNISAKKLRKLEIELHQSDRNITHLEYSILSYEHYLLSKEDEGTYTKIESERLGVTTRSIQTKVALGKKWERINPELKSMISEIDLRTKVDLKSLTALVEASEDEKQNVISKIEEIGVKNTINKDLKPLIAPIFTRLTLESRNRKLNKNLNTSQQKQEDKFTAEEFEKLDDIFINHEETLSVEKMKKLFQYEIKTHFKLKINKDEKSEIDDIQLECSIDFKEEIELIKSLMEKD